MKETFPLRTRFQWINAFAVKISLVILLTVCRTNLIIGTFEEFGIGSTTNTLIDISFHSHHLSA